MASVERCPAAGLGALRAEVADLRKYAALNYVAVIKAVKKRNRHLGAAVGSRQLRPLRALDLLSTQHFYTSPKLAALATQAELLSQARAAGPSVPFPPSRGHHALFAAPGACMILLCHCYAPQLVLTACQACTP